MNTAPPATNPAVRSGPVVSAWAPAGFSVDVVVSVEDSVSVESVAVVVVGDSVVVSVAVGESVVVSVAVGDSVVDSVAVGDSFGAVLRYAQGAGVA